MADKYDLVIVGAGNGGNMAACRASMMGLKTLVVEKHNMVGGSATSFVRGRFEFEASLHEIPDFGQGEARGMLGHLFDELGINMEWLPIPDAFRYIVADGKERTLDVTVPHGREEFISYMEAQCPGCSDSLRAMFRASGEIARGLAYVGQSRGNPDMEVLKKDYSVFMRMCGASAGDAFRAMEMPQKCIDIMGAYWPYQGSDLDTIDATRYLLMLDGYFTNGAYMPKMRSHEIANAIQRRARQLGCDYWMETEVSKILTSKGRVCGIETTDGRQAKADAVISNVFPDVVYSKMLDDKSLIPPFELKKANARTYGSRGFCVYLGLDASAKELGIKDYAVFINSSADTKVQYEKTFTRSGKGDNVCATCLNVVNPDATPEGTCHFAITTSFAQEAWGDVTVENYETEKREYALKLIKRYEEVMGIDLRSHIEEIAIATPITFARYLASPQGSMYGYQSAKWDGMSARTLVGGSEPTVPGLFFVGAHGSRLSGYFPTLSDGDLTARKVMGYVMGGGR